MNEKIRNEDRLFSFDDLLKNLKNEEFKMTQNDKVINYVKNKNTQEINENSNDENVDESKLKIENSKNNSYYRCDEFDHIANDCKHKKSKCHNCDRINHLRNNCRSEKKKSKENDKDDSFSKNKNKVVYDIKTINFISKLST